MIPRRARRSVEVFSLSFLDCICCGFGAIILLLVLTRHGEPARIEQSRINLHAQLRNLQQQLRIIRGDSDDLQRQLLGREAQREREHQQLQKLAGDLSRLKGRYPPSTQHAARTNATDSDPVAAQQTLTKEMRQMLQDRQRQPSAPIAGIAIDSEYVIFVVDTSSSMTENHWGANLAVIDEILSLYPHIDGLQVMNDQGIYLFGDTRGRWLADSPGLRARIRSQAVHWHAFSESNPVPGIEEALRTYRARDKRISVFVLGDEFTGSSIPASLDAIDRLNRPDAAGRPAARIHAIGFPEAEGTSPFTNIRFSALMRLVCEQNNGTFVGL